MPLSYSEHAALTCPSCGAGFEAEAWMLVDAAERPDLAHELREGTLNAVTCPGCGQSAPAGAPLLFHDPSNRRVYFAAPPGADEYQLREQAQSLLYLLVGGLPEEARLPYLGDVQVEQEVEGVRRAVLRRQRARTRASGAGPVGSGGPAGAGPVGALREAPLHREAPAPAHGAEHHVVSAAPPHAPEEAAPIVAAVRALLAADTADEFTAIVDTHPALLDAGADAAILQLAEVAQAQGERDVAAALREVHVTLAELRASRPAEGERGRGGEGERSVSSSPPLPLSSAPLLPNEAYQALLRATSPDELLAAIRDYPALLEPWADAALAERGEAALDEGNERLAQIVEERRETLAELRAELAGQAPLLQAIEALLQSRDEETIAQVLDQYPILLADAAQEALFTLAAAARSQGDRQLADYAVECRAMLRRVRAGLEEG